MLPPGVDPLRPSDPEEVGGYRVVGRLGAGGMGIVYLGCDPGGGLVAIKTTRPDNADDAEVRRRFRREVACALRVPASWTACVLADGTDRTPPYIVTEYVEGPPLEQVVESGGSLEHEQLHALATGVARALAAIHAAGLIHRDLKPANVLLSPTGPRVIDFGIAQQVPAAGGTTGSGIVMGSSGWIPPERLTGGPATAASDVFGWGALVAYAATGRNPFGKGDYDRLARRTLHEEPDLTGLAAPLREIVAAALAKDPGARPSVARLLDRLTGGTGPLVPATRPEGGRHRRRRRAWLLAAGPVAAAATGVLVLTANGTERTDGPGGDRAAPPGPSTAPPSRTGRPDAPGFSRPTPAESAPLPSPAGAREPADRAAGPQTFRPAPSSKPTAAPSAVPTKRRGPPRGGNPHGGNPHGNPHGGPPRGPKRPPYR